MISQVHSRMTYHSHSSMKQGILTFLTLVLLAGCIESTSNQNPGVFMTAREFFNGYAAALLTYSPETKL